MIRSISRARERSALHQRRQGVLRHIYLKNLAIHDVMGNEMKHKESGLLAITPGTTEQHFDDVLIDGVTAWNTDQWSGIVRGWRQILAFRRRRLGARMW